MINRKEFSAGGICHMICEANLPDLPDGKAGTRIKKILQELSETVLRSAEQALPSLSRQYEEDPDPKKAFRHRPLSLSIDFFLEEEAHVYRIPWVLRLSRAGRILFQKNGEARFDKRSGYLLGKRKTKKPKHHTKNAAKTANSR